MMLDLPSRWSRGEIRSARGPKEFVDPKRTIAQWDEFEIASPNVVAPTRVLLLAGSECRFTCTMCDLWRHTLDQATSPGDLVLQIRDATSKPWTAMRNTPSSAIQITERWIKLYNSSNFFDPFNVPREDLAPIAHLLSNFQRVIVENHPRLLRDTIPFFQDQLSGQLEIAMGLETTDAAMLRWLNKGMVLDDFKKAMAQFLQWNIDARVFLLLGLPGRSYSESLDLCLNSIELARSLGVRHCSVIPTRTQHSILTQLTGEYRVPTITAAQLERALSLMLSASLTLVTVDLWDWDRLPGHCTLCRQQRKERLEAMCLQQAVLPPPPLQCDCQNDNHLSSALKPPLSE